MKMLILRNGRNFEKLRACVPIVRTKTRKYGAVLDEHWMPTQRDWMILGANAAGKTRWLQRLHRHADRIWRDKPTLLLRAVDPIGAWSADPRIQAHMESTTKQPWSKTKAWEKTDWLIRWVGDTHAVLLLDDAHQLAGRKLDVVQQLALVAGRIVTGASQESRIPINLRLALLRRHRRIPVAVDPGRPGCRRLATGRDPRRHEVPGTGSSCRAPDVSSCWPWCCCWPARPARVMTWKNRR